MTIGKLFNSIQKLFLSFSVPIKFFQKNIYYYHIMLYKRSTNDSLKLAIIE